MDKLAKIPKNPGVYLFKNNGGKVLYVGKATNLANRVKSYVQSKTLGPKTTSLVSKVKNIDWILVESELEALLLEAALIKKYLPFYNTQAKDDKHPLYLKITKKEEYPRVTTSRREDEKGAIYFGPFPSSQTVRQILKLLRRVFPYCAQKQNKRPCFYSHLGLCDPCPAWVEKLSNEQKGEERKRYLKNINQLMSVLKGRNKSVKRQLEEEMKLATKLENFEEAARIRDQIARLDYITTPYKAVQEYIENPNLLFDIRRQEEEELFNLLAKKLRLKKIPKRIECFDASHLAGTSATVAMVTFIKGEPEKSLYRKFKIKAGEGDDLKLLSEAILRRFKHKEWGYPDLLVIDGGKGQVKTAKEALFTLKLKIPVIGLAKQFEDVIIPKKEGFLILRPKADSDALKLLQRLRDEAHRFARVYHHHLRLASLTR